MTDSMRTIFLFVLERENSCSSAGAGGVKLVKR
jgi:hypothetical protein